MSALIVRALQPQRFEPARSAAQIVNWFAARRWTMDLLLVALPLTAFILGSVALLRAWRADADLSAAATRTLTAIRAHWEALLILAATLAAAGILTVVGVHVITD
ncbi:MAG: hypothetical protein ACRENS_05945 [Candidatus Eiseniibacteriota bacterium]